MTPLSQRFGREQFPDHRTAAAGSVDDQHLVRLRLGQGLDHGQEILVAAHRTGNADQLASRRNRAQPGIEDA